MKEKAIKVLKSALWFLIGMPIINLILAKFFGLTNFVFEGKKEGIIEFVSISLFTGILVGIMNLYKTKKIDKQ